MKAFMLTRDQIARIVVALAADELSYRFKRHVDFLTLASWTEETPLGEGGLALAGAERTACVARISRFFGMDAEELDPAGERVLDWAHAAESSVTGSFHQMSFTGAGRDSATESSLHPADEIYADAAAIANILYGRRRLVSLVAPHGLIGFVATVLTPNLQRIPSLDARGMAPEALAGALAFGDVVVATPSLWRYLIAENVKAPDNAMGVCFGEEMTAELAADMRKAGFGAVREIYGSTETGIVGWRDSPGELFVLFDHWRRDPVAGALVRRAPSGTERVVEAMDRLEWDGDRRFRLCGRRDGAVQIGGINVFPDAIAGVIRAHPLVEECRISVSRRAGGMRRLVARIALMDGAAPNESSARSIDSWCRSQLRPSERPRLYSFEAEISDDGPEDDD